MQRKPLDQMTPEEIRSWIQTKREWIKRKIQRDQNYIKRRAARGTRTPTDETIEQDHIHLEDFLVVLDEMEKSLQPGTGTIHFYGP